MPRFILLLLLSIGLTAVSCSKTTVAANDGTEQPLVADSYQTQQPCKPSSKHVEFENVSFDYDLCAFGEVTAKKVPDYRLEHADDIPDSVEPRHVDFAFEKGPKGWEPTIDIFPLAEFPKMLSARKESEKAMRDQIEDLKKVLKDKDFRKDNQIPYLRWIDASQDFQTNVKLVGFQNGNGIFFATYLDTEISLIGNDHLRYIFEGITSDGKYYILADTPIAAAFLPNGPPEDAGGNSLVDHWDVEGFSYNELVEMVRAETDNAKTSRYFELKKKHDAYFSAVTSHMENSQPEEFTPQLKSLEELIASLKIGK